MLKKGLEKELNSKVKIITRLKNRDEDRRKAFSRVLGFKLEEDEFYGRGWLEREKRDDPLVWEEIFCEVGKLLMDRAVVEIEKNNRKIEQEMKFLNERVRKVENPELLKK